MGQKQVRFCFCKRWETLHAVADSFRSLDALEKVRS